MWVVLANELQARLTGLKARPEHLVPCSPQPWVVHSAGDCRGCEAAALSAWGRGVTEGQSFCSAHCLPWPEASRRG